MCAFYSDPFSTQKRKFYVSRDWSARIGSPIYCGAWPLAKPFIIVPTASPRRFFAATGVLADIIAGGSACAGERDYLPRKRLVAFVSGRTGRSCGFITYMKDDAVAGLLA